MACRQAHEVCHAWIMDRGIPDEAVLAEMRAVLDKMVAIQMVDVHLHQHPPRVGDRL